MKKLFFVLVISTTLVGCLQGCATGIGYWNQLSPETQVALIQQGRDFTQDSLTSYLNYCHDNKVAVNTAKLNTLKAELDAANEALKTASDALIKDKSK
jgi:hypothetical protein